MKKFNEAGFALAVVFAAALSVCAAAIPAQTAQDASPQSSPGTQQSKTQDYNRRIQELRELHRNEARAGEDREYRIGAHDLLEINVFEAPELNRSLRVSAGGEISMPLIGGIQSAGLTAKQLETVLEDRLRAYIKDPHVGVFVSTIESHPISVVGAVKKPGVFEVRGPKTVLETLSMAEGLDEDAGNEVLVMRGAGLLYSADASQQGHEQSHSAATPKDDALPGAPDRSEDKDAIRINLKDLLESGDSRYNVEVDPGDIVKVTRAGIVYVVGDVKKPGGFVLKNDQKASVLKAIALAEGLTRTSAKSRLKIIRTDEKSGEQTEIPIDLGRILAGKAPDAPLQPSDIVFVPSSAGKNVLYRGTEAAVVTASGLIIFH